jgi:hypothetical protein
MRRFLRLLTLALLVPAGAHATLVTALPLEELAAQSDLVLFGEVESTEPFVADDGRVYTRVSVRPLDGGTVVQVLQLGGRVDDLVTRVPGADVYSQGESIVVFLEHIQDNTYQSLSLSFSKFTLDREAGLARRTVDVGALAPSMAGPPLPPPALAYFPEQVPLADIVRLAPLAPRVLGLPSSGR